MHRPNLYRCAYGLLIDFGEANFTTAALLNNSNGPEILLVWQLTAPTVAAVQYQFVVAQDKKLTGGSQGKPVYPTSPAPPGLLQNGNLLASTGSDWAFGNTAITLGWPATFPFTALPPGWGLYVQNNTTPTGAIDLFVWWEAIHPVDFDRRYGFGTLPPSV